MSSPQGSLAQALSPSTPTPPHPLPATLPATPAATPRPLQARVTVVEYLKERGLFRGTLDNPMRLGLCSR